MSYIAQILADLDCTEETVITLGHQAARLLQYALKRKNKYIYFKKYL